jgi:hypothetical protein
MSVDQITVCCVHVKDGKPPATVMTQPTADVFAYPENGGPAVGVVNEVRLCNRCAKRGNPKTMFYGEAAITMTAPEPYICREARTDGEIIAGPWHTEQECALELFGKWPALRCTPKTMMGEGRSRPALLIWPTPENGLPTVMVLGPGFRKEIWNRRARS